MCSFEKFFIFFQNNYLLKSMFEEASWTLKIEARNENPIGPPDRVPPLGRTKNRFNFDWAILGRLGPSWGRLGGSKLGVKID